MNQREILAQAARSQLARAGLIDFCAHMNDGFVAPPHLVYVADLLEKVEAGAQVDGRVLDRVLIALPPGVGKSVLLQHFAAWSLARAAVAGKEHRIITVSGSADLAERNSRAARGLFSDPRWPFPEVTISGETFSQTRWEILLRGKPTKCGMLASSVESKLMGFRAHRIILDDLVTEAGTAISRQTLVEWFNTELSSRLTPIGGSMVYIGNRLHIDDLFSTLAASHDRWFIVALPTVAGLNDPMGRKPGSIMWPYTREELDRRRLAIGLGPYAALYDNDPQPPGGSIFKRESMAHRFNPNDPGEYEHIVLSVDPAASTSATADNSAIVVAASTETRYHILDVVAGRWSYPRLKEMVQSVHRKWPDIESVLIEGSSNGLPCIDELRQTTSLPIVKITPSGSKGDRADSITTLFESGLVLLPEGAAWIPEFVDEMAAFSPLGTSKHDDRVDACVQALVRLRERMNRPRLVFTATPAGERHLPWGGRRVAGMET